MRVAAPSHTSFEEYLVAEAASDIKHEWCDGVVYTMSRGTPEHGRLTMRIARIIGNVLEGECEMYSSDTMLYIEPAALDLCRCECRVWGGRNQSCPEQRQISR